MRRELLALCLLLIVISLSACGLGSKKIEAVRRCKELVLEEEGKVTNLSLSPGNGPNQVLVYEISPIEDWEVVLEERPISQADKMNSIDWRAEIQIIHALKIHKGWIDARTICYVHHSSDWGMRVEHHIVQAD